MSELNLSTARTSIREKTTYTIIIILALESMKIYHIKNGFQLPHRFNNKKSEEKPSLEHIPIIFIS